MIFVTPHGRNADLPLKVCETERSQAVSPQTCDKSREKQENLIFIAPNASDEAEKLEKFGSITFFIENSGFALDVRQPARKGRFGSIVFAEGSAKRISGTIVFTVYFLYFRSEKCRIHRFVQDALQKKSAYCFR